ncbi:MAG: 4Fe-4S dicluster domain-containing protein [Planctomycetota bacterium]|jgi:ferredoxin|nr:4Fe-4S dicluster domain-containing protein [Planctomycetota bacterium]
MSQSGVAYLILRSNFDSLLAGLKQRGFLVVGPTVQEQAIVYDELGSTADLPTGWTDEQDGGTYRLKRRQDEALFGYNLGPHSFKKYLHPPSTRLWKATVSENGFDLSPEPVEKTRYAFVGVRSCELHAMAIQSRVFLDGPYTHTGYQERQKNALTIAVNCGQAGKTCFCTSMGTGPKVTEGFDIAMTEVVENGEHYFVAEAGTEEGQQVLEEMPHTEAGAAELQAAERQLAAAEQQMGLQMETAELRDLLIENMNHSRWDHVADRCLSCANCTMVCPTCFCTTVEDVNDLTGENAERWQRWDSCFTMDFSYIHGGSVRPTTKARYRQWMTHKLATWHDQFDSSGCVGCGRCITWCPVGIDITEEVQAIRESPENKGENNGSPDT